MEDHWKQNGPPVYMAVAAYMGLIKDDKKSYGSDEDKYGNLEELETMFSGSGGMIGA